VRRWADLSDATGTAGTALLDVLFQESRQRIEGQRAAALRVALLWAGPPSLGVAAVVLGVRAVAHRVLGPLGRLQASMLTLAEGNLDAPLPERGSGDEMAAMADALRVFKANAIRRSRLQDERAALHDRLQATYRQLRADMEAAGAVQAALLPAPGRIGGLRFLGRLRPSQLISGDSFDVLRQPNGAVHFFLVDVAGHGAASALVSVASHYTLTQAIQRRHAGEGLAEIVAAVNRDWPDHLPYFTLVLGELRPEIGEGTLVQAGHPSPVLLRRGDGVEALGQGGLPVGVLRGADYEEIRFPFGPGDRLVVYSDGLTEAEDRAGQAFGEARLHELLGQHHAAGAEEILEAVAGSVRRWGASEELDDDMTLLILEAMDDEHDRRDARDRAGAAGA
jgi:serine phosphatase RsbU (regulator of sigma subunit)